MLKRSLVLLLFLSNILSDSSVILPHQSKRKLASVEEALIMMLEKCNLGLKNIIFCNGNSSDLTNALLTIPQPEGLRSSILLSTLKIKNLGNVTAIDGIVMVFNSHHEWARTFDPIVSYSRSSENCTLIYVSKIPKSCAHAKQTLSSLGYSHFDNVYYICDDEAQGPIVLTQNRYEDSRPPRWLKINWKTNNCLYPWTFYYRKYNADLCRNFNFNRTYPKENIKIMVGHNGIVANKASWRPDRITDGDIDKLGGKMYSPTLKFFQRLLKIKFIYYVKFSVQDNESFIPRSETKYFWIQTCTDMTSAAQEMDLRLYEAYLYPTVYGNYIILSHMPRPATPLEKIAHFYGIWTLASLITILIIVFFVIYWKTNRNGASAFFDALSLLINGGVATPINTLSLKIFFCMVFLYFMVIHATFSGNLPKFLTIPEFHDTIDTIEDLANPRITTIYSSRLKNYNVKNIEVIKNKTKVLWGYHFPVQKFLADKNSAWIVSENSAKVLAFKNQSSTTLHISKSTFQPTMAARVVRPRFFLREKFNWAATYIFDVGVDINWAETINNATRIIEREQILSQIDFRPISIDDLKFAFILLIIGNILGLICFVMELVIHKKYHQKVNLKWLTRVSTFKLRKKPNNIRRIVVQPKSSTTRMFKPGRNQIVLLNDSN